MTLRQSIDNQLSDFKRSAANYIEQNITEDMQARNGGLLKHFLKFIDDSKDQYEPVSLFILGEGGIRLSSVAFVEQEIDYNLVAGFLAAMQDFTAEIFAQRIDRIKLEDYTLIVKFKPPFTFVYVFVGSESSAHKKLDKFLDSLHMSEEWTALELANRTGLMIDHETNMMIRKKVYTVLAT